MNLTETGSDVSVVLDDLDDSENEPSAKKTKHSAETESTRILRVQTKIVKDINKMLAMTDFKGRMEEEHVRVSIVEGKFVVSVLCLLCENDKYHTILGTAYTADPSNYRRHFTRCHLVKGTKLEQGVKIKQTKGQPSVSTYYKSNPSAASSNTIDESNPSTEDGDDGDRSNSSHSEDVNEGSNTSK